MVSCNDSRNLLLYPKGYSEEEDKYLSLLLELDNWEYFLLNKKIYAEFNLRIRNEYHGHDQEITDCCDLAFWREAVGKSFCIRAVVVDHEILLHPFQPFQVYGIRFTGQPTARSCSRRPYTYIGFEICIRSSERSLCPICFNEPASRRPVISIPNA